MEQLKEENHKLLLKIENLKKSHATEVEFLKEELELKEKDVKSALQKVRDEAKAKENLKNEKISSLTEEMTIAREENETQGKEIEQLRTQVEILKRVKSGGAGTSNYSDYEGLKESQRTLRAQLCEKDELLTTQTEKIKRLTDQLDGFRNAIAALTEEVEGKDSIVKELQSRVKEIENTREEEHALMQNEVLALKEQIKNCGGGAVESNAREGGGSSRGNSLFSEVEERRVKVEQELTRLRSLVKKLTDENRELHLDLERGDTHSASINTQLELISKNENELAIEIKKHKSETLQLFDTYRDRFENLRSEYTKKLKQYKSGSSSTTPSELETLRTERDTLLMYKLSMERENNELKRELKYNKHLRMQTESNLKIARAKIEWHKKNPNEPERSEFKMDVKDIEPDVEVSEPTPKRLMQEEKSTECAQQ
ncbi:unnamed protein product [Orchesella dallaii]|uniref:Uncharacterized protein n=1 Tax=Orchesella dallaii TaxID=48710 RepID=A0ABP1PKF8_9HEXA